MLYKWPSPCRIGPGQSLTYSYTITTHGRPVFICFMGDSNPDTETAWFFIHLYRDGRELTAQLCDSRGFSNNTPFNCSYLDIVPAGTYTYSLNAANGEGTINFAEEGAAETPVLFIYEV